MDIHIHKDGQQVGPYSLEQVNEQLAQGTLQPTDLAFHEGLSNWTPLSQVAGVNISGALPPHPPVPQPAVAQAVSAQPNNTGKYLLFGGIAAGLILLFVAVCVGGYFIYKAQKEPAVEMAAYDEEEGDFEGSPDPGSGFSMNIDDKAGLPETRPFGGFPSGPGGSTAIEAAIRQTLGKPTGELTSVDLSRVVSLSLENRRLTNISSTENLQILAKLKQLKVLRLQGNPAITAADIEKIKGVLPKRCNITSDL